MDMNIRVWEALTVNVTLLFRGQVTIYTHTLLESHSALLAPENITGSTKWVSRIGHGEQHTWNWRWIGFPSSHVWMWELDYKESWALKNWCFWTSVLERTLESPLDCKEIQPVHPKGNQSWIFVRRTDAEAETSILWPPDVKNWLIGKDSDAGKDWRWEDKMMTEDEMVGWHHQLDGHEFEKAPGVGEGQGKSPGFILL